MREGTVECPHYRKVKQEGYSATSLFMVCVDEGWRESIVCCDMYEWAADWLVEQLQGKPYANENRP